MIPSEVILNNCKKKKTPGNSNLALAKKRKNDEFYTRRVDIDKELCHYTKHFEGKTILCNCDDGIYSEFFRYFAAKFNALGLKKLIGVSYAGSPRSEGKAYKLELTSLASDTLPSGTMTDEDWFNFTGITPKPLAGDGDFRSAECVELLNEADIVVTNPPFSLLREYIAQLMQYDKKFLIIGNMNAITYKEVFPYIKSNAIWFGYKFNGVPMKFNIPDGVEPYGSVRSKDDNGNWCVGVNATRWITNLAIAKINEPLELIEEYTPEKYPKYDNYDAINVNKTLDIPADYFGIMGVPISFLDKYCPEQFEIIKFRKGNDEKDLSVNGKCPYFRILIRRKDGAN